MIAVETKTIGLIQTIRDLAELPNASQSINSFLFSLSPKHAAQKAISLVGRGRGNKLPSRKYDDVPTDKDGSRVIRAFQKVNVPS